MNRPSKILKYQNANAGHDFEIKLIYPMMGRMWMAKVVGQNPRFPKGTNILVCLDDLKEQSV